MCLDAITAKHRPTREVVEGWKVMINAEKGVVFEIYAPRYGLYVRPLRWMKAEHRHTGGGYMSGFHVFETAEDARAYSLRHSYLRAGLIVLPVKVRGVRVHGQQDGQPVLVADEIMFPELPDKKEPK